jgi:hypothetical protein
MNITHNAHNENYNPKSVTHANMKEASEENSRVRETRNKSVLGKVDLKAVQKQNYALTKKILKEPVTERNSFNQNHSVANLHEKYK